MANDIRYVAKFGLTAVALTASVLAGSLPFVADGSRTDFQNSYKPKPDFSHLNKPSAVKQPKFERYDLWKY